MKTNTLINLLKIMERSNINFDNIITRDNILDLDENIASKIVNLINNSNLKNLGYFKNDIIEYITLGIKLSKNIKEYTEEDVNKIFSSGMFDKLPFPSVLLKAKNKIITCEYLNKDDMIKSIDILNKISEHQNIMPITSILTNEDIISNKLNIKVASRYINSNESNLICTYNCLKKVCSNNPYRYDLNKDILINYLDNINKTKYVEQQMLLVSIFNNPGFIKDEDLIKCAETVNKCEKLSTSAISDILFHPIYLCNEINVKIVEICAKNKQSVDVTYNMRIAHNHILPILQKHSTTAAVNFALRCVEIIANSKDPLIANHVSCNLPTLYDKNIDENLCLAELISKSNYGYIAQSIDDVLKSKNNMDLSTKIEIAKYLVEGEYKSGRELEKICNYLLGYNHNEELSKISDLKKLRIKILTKNYDDLSINNIIEILETGNEKNINSSSFKKILNKKN